jgi:hypothetical protein
MRVAWRVGVSVVHPVDGGPRFGVGADNDSEIGVQETRPNPDGLGTPGGRGTGERKTR